MISATLGYSRQYFYKHVKGKQVKAQQEQQVLSFVHAERKILPRLGGKKTYKQLQPMLQALSLKFGRDKVLELLRRHDLHIKPLRRYVQTTNSRHYLRKHPNRLKGLTITGPEQVWVSDITYIKTDEGNCYANMITDGYSRKIMGYAIAENMDTESMKQAYEMALKERKYPYAELIHHSDRGLQYCSKEYVALSENNQVGISMTENGDPYENALAERMNRIIKEEFGLGRRLPSKQQAFRLMDEAVKLYNERRPHWALNLKTPNEVHLQKIPATEVTGTLS